MTKVLYVKTSDTCNLNCDQCFTSGRYGSKDKWDAEASVGWVKAFIAQYPQEDQFIVVFHGGEPMLADNDDMHWFMDQLCDDPRVVFTISTNLVYKLTETRLSFLQRLNSIGTSWDLDERFENQAQLDLWHRNLDKLHQCGLTYHIFVTVTRALVDYPIGDFLDMLKKAAPATVRLERLTLGGNADRNPMIFPDNETQDNWFLSVYQQYKARREELGFSIVTLDTIETKVWENIVKADTSCRNCEQNLVTLNADGSLSGCPNAAAEKKHSHIVDGVTQFLHSQGRVEEITHELDFHPQCLQCDVFSICGGDCHRLSWQGNRCAGLKNLIRHIKRQRHQQPDLISLTTVE